MEELLLKKRKVEERAKKMSEVSSSEEDMRSLLDPLPKPQLVDLLAKLGSQYPSIAEEIKSVATADPVHRKLFVRGLAWNTSSETLCAAFQEHGEIEEGAVIIDKVTGKSRGYGFITYKDMESARRALKAPSKLIDGRMAVCNLACEGLSSVSATPDQAQRKLYIGSLSPDTTTEMLLLFFGRHGEIEEGSVAYDKNTNKSRGFGFISYKTLEAAKKAIEDPQKTLGGRSITVKLADNNKSKVVVQTQVPAVVQMPIPPWAGYPHPGSADYSITPVGYTYPQLAGTYPITAFQSPQAAAAGSYPTHPVSYSLFPVKKESVAPSPTLPAGLSGYPYYFSKQ